MHNKEYFIYADSIISDSLQILFNSDQSLIVQQNGLLIRDNKFVNNKSKFIGKWKLDKSLRFIRVYNPDNKIIIYLKIMILNEEEVRFSFTEFPFENIYIFTEHKLIKQKYD